MIAEVKGFATARLSRRPVTDLEPLAQAAAAVSQLGKYEQIAEAEINPLLICEASCNG